MKTAYTKSSKMGRTLLKNNTNKLVTHLLQNEDWMNKKITELQNLAEGCRACNDLTAANDYDKEAADMINQHRLFVADLLPYCLPKLSATMNNDNDEAQKLLEELMSVGKHAPVDSAIVTENDGETFTLDKSDE